MALEYSGAGGLGGLGAANAGTNINITGIPSSPVINVVNNPTFSGDVTIQANLITNNSNNLTDLTTVEVTQLLNIDTSTISAVQWGYLGALDQGLTQASNVVFAQITMTNPISLFSIDGTMVGNSDTTIPSEKAIVTYVAAQISSGISSAISGTTGTIPVFTGANAIGDSIITEVGAVITVTGALTITSTVTTANSNNLGSLTTVEVTQLLNIDATTIASAAWTQVGGITKTHVGLSGGQGLDTPTTQANWSDLGWLYSAMIHNTVGVAQGAPVNNYGFFIKIAQRDSAGGWGGLWLGYSADENYLGRTATSATYATWEKLAMHGTAVSFSGITVVNAMDEFSTDGTMAGNSDTAFPSEAAVVTYVGSAVTTAISGSVGYIPKFTGVNAIGNSIISEAANLISIANAELDLTGVNASIDLNPANTGDHIAIDITPSAALTGAGAQFSGLNINLAATDPAAGVLGVYGIYIEMGGVSQVNNPETQGIGINMPATYGSGSTWAGKFTGDAKTVILCDTTNAIHVDAGNVQLDENITVDGIIKLYDATGPYTSNFAYTFGGDANGNGIIMSSGGAFILGSGESATGYQSGGGIGATVETLHLTSDNDIIFVSGMQSGYANRFEMKFLSTGELDITGSTADPVIDLNPAHTDSAYIISIVPTAALSNIGATWRGIYIDGSNLDPTQTACNTIGLTITFNGLSTASDPDVYGISVSMPTVPPATGDSVGASFSNSTRIIHLATSTYAIETFNTSTDCFFAGETFFGSVNYSVDESGIATFAHGYISGTDPILWLNNAVASIRLGDADTGPHVITWNYNDTAWARFEYHTTPDTFELETAGGVAMQVQGNGRTITFPYGHTGTSWGLTQESAIIVGVDGSAAGRIRIYGKTASGGGSLLCTTNNFHLDSVGGAMYLNNYTSAVVYLRGSATNVSTYVEFPSTANPSDSGTTAIRIGNNGANAFRVYTNYGTVDIGPQNASYCHVYSSLNFYTNKLWYFNSTSYYINTSGHIRMLTGYFSTSVTTAQIIGYADAQHRILLDPTTNQIQIYPGDSSAYFGFKLGSTSSSSKSSPYLFSCNSAGTTLHKYGDIGTAVAAWYRMYAEFVYDDNGAIGTFDEYDDLALIDAISVEYEHEVDVHGDPILDKDGNKKYILDSKQEKIVKRDTMNRPLIDHSTIPEPLKEEGSRWSRPAHIAMFSVGAVKQLHEKVKEQEQILVQYGIEIQNLKDQLAGG